MKLLSLCAFLGLIKLAVSDDDFANKMLEKHNEYRRKLQDGLESKQPKPYAMPNLVWDEELVETAQAAADRCDAAYTPMKLLSTYDRRNRQENVAFSINEDPKESDIVREWYEFSISGYDFASNQCNSSANPLGKDCESYKTIAKSGNVRLGCAKQMCSKLGDRQMIGTVFYCHYSTFYGETEPTQERPYLTKEMFIEEFLNRMNKYRNDLVAGLIEGEPKAAFMSNLTWDEDLAAKAKEVAGTCISETVHNAALPKDHPNAKGNTDFSYNSDYKISRTLYKWFEESRQGYDFDENYCPQYNEYNIDCTNYKMMVWAEATKVGCGVHWCHHLDDFPAEILMSGAYLTCYYSPIIGWDTKRPYVKA